MSETLKFDLTRKEQAVSLNTENGPASYILRELIGADRDHYLTKMGDRMRYEKGKPAGLKSFDGLQALLVHLHLYDDDGNRVPSADIQKYPSTVVTALFDACQQLSGLGDEDEEEVGND